MSQTRAVEPWALEPLKRFVAESGARLALLTTPAGQGIAQHGFTRAVDVRSAAALGAAIPASRAGSIRMRPAAIATRRGGGLGPTSTIRGEPRSSKWGSFFVIKSCPFLRRPPW